MRWPWLALAALLLAGCTGDPGGDEGPLVGGRDPPPPTPSGPPLVFAGDVRDARSGDLVLEASVRLDLAQTQPCGRQGIGWRSWEAEVSRGTWGPIEVPRPRSDDVAFFLHAMAPGYSENATFIGPTQARGDIGNTTLLLHPDASVQGTAPPGTLVALDAPIFPRVTLAGENGTFAFHHARVADAFLVAGTDVPYRSLVRAPANVDVPAVDAGGWTLEGAVKGPSGAPLAANVVAWNGTQLWSVARSSDSGVFTMPLPPQAATLRVEARTGDNHFGGVLTLDLRGPPALRETVLAKALC